MRRTTCRESAHTADAMHAPADISPANNGLPNRLMTAFEVAESIGCHEETVRRAYLRGSPDVAALRRQRKEVPSCRRPRLDSSRRTHASLVNRKEDLSGCSKTVSQQRLQGEPSLRPCVVARRDAPRQTLPDAGQ
jgi:hypothetical protein